VNRLAIKTPPCLWILSVSH